PLIAKEHHERIDGSGYPDGKCEGQIGQLAKIVAVADVYDAMTSDRVYREKMKPCEAIRVLENLAGNKLDPVVTDALMERLAHYPVGTRLLLGTGELAVVCAQNPSRARRPRVRIVADGDWNPLSPREQSEVELAERGDVEIESVLDDYPQQMKAALNSLRS
ncbi:MAG: HD-GYP domain-containing protein, partial [Bacillota bacterium]